jgi:hypothetical protein
LIGKGEHPLSSVGGAMEIPVKLAVPVNAHSATKIFQEVVKFVLYFQNQCPG